MNHDALFGVLGASAAGVAVLDAQDLRFVTATNDLGAQAEHIQERTQNGPYLASIHQNRPVVIADLAEYRPAGWLPRRLQRRTAAVGRRDPWRRRWR